MPFTRAYFSQQDSQWKEDILGFGDPGDTIGYVGCALTSLTMLVSGHGYAETPKSFNEKIKAKNGFISAGIRWEAVSQVHPQVALKSNISCDTSDAPLAQIDAALSAGQPVVVRVDSSPAAGLQWHYVLLYAREGNDYLMLDPWPYNAGANTHDLLLPRYSHGNSLSRAIQQVLIYECTTSGGGTVSTPAPTPVTTTPPQPAPVTGSPSTSGVYARPTSEVTAFMNLRSTTDTVSTGNVIGQIFPGTQLLLLEADGPSKIGMNGQMLRVRTPQGQEGYVAAWFLERVSTSAPSAPTPSTPSAPASQPAKPASQPAPSSTAQPAPVDSGIKVVVSSFVDAKGLSVYMQASAKSAVVAAEPANVTLAVVEPAATAKPKIGISGQWLYVRASNGKTGYVRANFVKLAK